LRHQVFKLLAGQAEDKIGRKAPAITADLLVQPARLDAVERRKIGMQQNLEPITSGNARCAVTILAQGAKRAAGNMSILARRATKPWAKTRASPKGCSQNRR